MSQTKGRREARDASRREAFKALYEASLRSQAPVVPEDPIAAKLVKSVDESFDELVALIGPWLKSGWRFERLALSEQFVLLLGASELVGLDHASPGVVGAWTHIADLYGGPNSHKFINAILTGLSQAKPAPAPEDPESDLLLSAKEMQE